MIFDIITIFPKIFDCYFNESIIKRAKKKRIIEINIYNLRDFTNDKYKTVDDKPYSGGPGMLLKVEPIYNSVLFLKRKRKGIKSKTVLFSAKGKIFNQKTAYKLSKFKNLILICGHYEGVDERVAKYIADQEISIGEYILTSGELPAMIIIDSISRLLKGVIKKESLKYESFSPNGEFKNLEYPQYTRPEIFIPSVQIKKRVKNLKWKAPKILLSGNHKKIKEWQQKHSKYKT